MSNILITLGVIIVAVLSALFAVPLFVDWNSYRGVIEEEASRVIGRDVRIGGDIKLQLLPAPSFVIQKLRVADTVTGSGEPLFRAERVDAKLSILPLMRGAIEANQIELVKPSLRLVIDEAGHGNWRSLTQGRGTLSFMPNDVALQAVKITDGTVSVLDHAGARARLVVDHIEGQLSAPALEGPYRFRGGFGEGAQTRDLRFTTSPPDADGIVQVKATLKDIASSASVSLDGRLRELSGQPELSGELSALLPLPGAPSSPAPASGTETKRTSAPAADLKANLVGNPRQVALNNLSISFEGTGRPEVLAGEALFTWDGERKTVAKLSAPWIDLDNVLGNPKGGNPLLALADFGRRINGIGTGLGTASAVLQIDQANLGHEIIGGIRVEARSSAGLLAVEQLHANLPGGTKVEVQGRIVGEGGATTFDGDMTMRGTSIARLAAWATAGGTIVSPANDLPFQMRSRVTAEPARGGLREIFAEIGDSALEGEIDYAWSGARKLRIAIGGPRIDARALIPAKVNLRLLSELLGSSGDKRAASDLGIGVSVKTAELVLPDETWRDVSVVVESSAGDLQVDRLQFSGDHGVAVSLEGRVGANSQMRGSVAAADADGVQKLSEFFAFPIATLVPAALLPDMLPLSLAGTLTPAKEMGSKALAITVDGRAGLADAKIKVALGSGLDGWRQAPADVDIVLLAPSEARLGAKVSAALRLQVADASRDPVAKAVASRASEKGGPAVTRLALRATGAPATGMSTAVRYDSAELTAYLDGSSRIDSSDTLELTGDVTLEARDGRDVLDALGGRNLALADPLTLHGTARFAARGGGVSLSKIAMMAGGTQVSGQLKINPPAPSATVATAASPRSLTGDLSLSTVDVSSLLAPVLRRNFADAQAAILVASGRSGGWPEPNFDFSGNGAIDATIGLKANKLTIGDGAGLTNVELTLLSRRGALEFRDLTGTGLGGRLLASAVLDGTSTGAALTAKLDYTAIQLTNFGATGTADLAMTLTGSGINPAGLVSGLTGAGTLKLGPAVMREITPETLQSAIDTALKAPADKLSNALRTALSDDAVRAAVNIGPRTIALTVQDGVARGQAVTLPLAPGRIITQATLDLATFSMSGDWRVETRMPPLPVVPALPGLPIAVPVPTPATALPVVVQRFKIIPGDLDPSRRGRRQAPESEALERELAVRKVERDLAELERLRRLDEERAAREREAAKAASESADWARQTDVAPVVKPDAAATRQ